MTTNKNTPTLDVKGLNKNRVYRIIYHNSHISKPEIAHQMGVSLPTVTQNVKLLMENGLVREGGILDSTGGRKAVALTIAETARYAIGLDITRNHASGVLVDLNAHILYSTRERLPYSGDAGYAKKLAAIVDHLIGHTDVSPKLVLGIGIAVPGIVAENRQQVVNELSAYVLQTSNLPCQDLLRHIPFPGLFSNDANAAGLAEVWRSPLKTDAVYLSLSNTVGGAVLTDNTLRSGDNQRSGEFGHITLERSGAHCYCGQKGCVDVYCAASVLSEYTDGDLPRFFELLEQQDLKARAMWSDYLDYLATTVNILRMAFDCDVIVGGYVGAHMEPYLGKLQKLAAASVLYLHTFT